MFKTILTVLFLAAPSSTAYAYDDVDCDACMDNCQEDGQSVDECSEDVCSAVCE